MPGIPREAHNAIITSFDTNDVQVFTIGKLRDFIRSNRADWGLSSNVSRDRVIEYLRGTGKLRETDFTSAKYGVKTLYTWGHLSDFQLALAFVPGSYFSHQTAAFFHRLRKTDPGVLYLNREQAEKDPGDPDLSQDAIDRAFKNQPRKSRYVFSFRDRELCVVSGKCTRRLEVRVMRSPTGEMVPATGLERTLIDLAVRPQYAGGVDEVVSAYRAAKGRVTIRRVVDILKKLNYVYPLRLSLPPGYRLLFLKSGVLTVGCGSIQENGRTVRFLPDRGR